MAKEFTFVVRVLYEERDGLIYQIFQHNRKKGFRFILDKRFSIYYRFKDLMNKVALPDVFLFVERVERENDVVAIYKNINNIELKEEEHFFTLASFVAPSASCQYCVFKQEKNEMFFYCDKKEKDFVKEFKNCQFFRQKELFKT